MTTLIVQCVRFYQTISRMFPATPIFFGSFSGCRSWPTCSEYAIDAIQQQGVLRGGFRAIIRVLRCHPL